MSGVLFLCQGQAGLPRHKKVGVPGLHRKTLNPETSGALGERDTPIGQAAEIAALAWRVPDPAHFKAPTSPDRCHMTVDTAITCNYRHTLLLAVSLIRILYCLVRIDYLLNEE